LEYCCEWPVFTTFTIRFRIVTVPFWSTWVCLSQPTEKVSAEDHKNLFQCDQIEIWVNKFALEEIFI
jgi:hypothetical protein